MARSTSDDGRTAVCRAVEPNTETCATTDVPFRLKDEVEAWMPVQDWKSWRAVGNILRHSYDKVQLPTIWQIVKTDFPSLRRDCERTIDRLKKGEF
jgi:uncharacterized protein with HEPN domain